jgi:hypothetical protein
MKSHTPGPWRQTGPNVRAGDALICYVTNHHANAETPEPEKLANARLIASAPEMLAALALIYANAGESPEWIRARIAPVIEKAIGGSL